MVDYSELETLDMIATGKLIKLLELTDKLFKSVHALEGIRLNQEVFKLEDEYIEIKKTLRS